MFKFIAAIALLFASGAWAHDEHLVFSKAAVHAHVFWETKPSVDQEAVMRVEFLKASDHTPAELTGTLSVRVWMPSMRHGDIPTTMTPVTDVNGAVETGVYRVSNMYFFMLNSKEDRWQVEVTLTEADGSSETASFEADPSGESGHHHH